MHNATAAADGTVVRVYWPLYTVYPVALAVFWIMYLCVTPKLSLRYVRNFENWEGINQKCWAQNINSTIHAFWVVAGLIGVLLGGKAEKLREAGLHPFYDDVAYIDISVSLAYMSFVLPWSLWHYFGLQYREPHMSLAMCVHHACVVIAEASYLLTQVAPWYGALSIVLMEVTNWFYLPHLLMTQLSMREDSCYRTVNGFGFIIAYTGCRLFGCTYVGIAFLIDIATYPHSIAGETAAICFSLLAFLTLLGLSFFWYKKNVLPTVHTELKKLYGDRYWRKCIPRCCLSPKDKVSDECTGVGFA